MKKINRETAEHYNRKGTCDGWNFVKHVDFSVIAEKMPCPLGMAADSRDLYSIF